MMRIAAIVALMLASVAVLSGAAILQEAPPPPPPQASVLPEVGAAVRFEPVEVWIDSGDRPLAAYQLEVHAVRGAVKIVGIEGGAHALFAEPPYYDPAAMQQERVIIAAFSTANPKSLPTGRTRIATIHVQVTGTAAPEFESMLSVAADAGGKDIPATIAIVRRSES